MRLMLMSGTDMGWSSVGRTGVHGCAECLFNAFVLGLYRLADESGDSIHLTCSAWGLGQSTLGLQRSLLRGSKGFEFCLRHPRQVQRRKQGTPCDCRCGFPADRTVRVADNDLRCMGALPHGKCHSRTEHASPIM